MLRFVLAFSILATPALSQVNKEEDCRFQADVVAAIQKARLDRVRERNVPKAIEDTAPTWPDNYNAAIPIMTPWVYEQKMRDVRNVDLSDVWLELCLKQ